MRVLIVGEGKHEGGGALESLVQRLSAKPLQCEFDRVGRNDIHAYHGKGQGYLKKAIRWMREAENRGYDALVFLIDQDKWPERRTELNAAQEHMTIARIARAMGVAIRTFDAWMLADERAVSTTLECAVQTQADPEAMHDPKSVCKRLLDDSGSSITQAEMYAKIADQARLETLEQRCPRGFAPFATRVRGL